MENAVRNILKGVKNAKKKRTVSKIDYRIVFCAAAAFLVGGAAVFGVASPRSISFFAIVMIVLLSTYLLCKAVILWEEERRTDLDRVRHMLGESKKAFENLADVYGRAVCGKQVAEPESLKNLFKMLNEEVCGDCALKKNCWEIYTGRTEQFIKSMLSFAEEGNCEMMKISDRKNGFFCENRESMAIYTKNQWERMESEYKWKKKMEAGRGALAAQFDGISEVFGKAIKSVGEEESKCNRKTIEAVKTGVSKYAKDGIVCGDSCAGTRLNENTYLFLLSDGMGSGKRAAAESMLTINTIYQFMKAGFPPDAALSALNSILIMKSDEEIFSTVDIALLNTVSGVVSFYKAGSACAFIKRKGIVEVIKRGSLPVGIVENVKPENVLRRLKPSDLVVMVSDGIADAGSRKDSQQEPGSPELWVEKELVGIGSADPQVVADLILSKAIERWGDGEKDDMSVLAFSVN